jgi:phospholipid/cholesterol/gamma-HCH transport system substrate-binding protein
MNDRIMQFRVGVVVLATSIVGAILVTLNGPTSTDWIPGLQKRYQVTINLQDAPGIGPNTPIRKNGLLIGRVASVEDMQDYVAVIANIDSGRLLYNTYKPQVRSTLLGDSTIEFVTRPLLPGQQPVAEGYVFQGSIAPNPLDGLADIEGDLKIMINRLSEAGDGVSQLTKTLNAAIGTEPEAGRVPKLLDTAEKSMADLSRAAQTFDKFFGNPELTSTVREARMTMNDVRNVAVSIKEPVESIDRNLKNLEGFTGPLGRNGEQLSRSLIDGLNGLSRIVEEFTVLTEALNNRQGTIGRLIHDPSVYDNMNLVLCNANNLVLRLDFLAAKLRPIIDDVRVFTDKIAREPGRIVSGALNPSSVK